MDKDEKLIRKYADKVFIEESEKDALLVFLRRENLIEAWSENIQWTCYLCVDSWFSHKSPAKTTATHPGIGLNESHASCLAPFLGGGW
jgi:hypothetical protein